MATTLYLKSSSAQISRGTNTNNQRGTASDWKAYALSEAVGTGAGSSFTVSSIAGTTAGLEFPVGTPLAEWISEPLNSDVTISGTISFRFCGSESNSMANGSASFRVDRLNSTGEITSTVVTASHGTELTASTVNSPGPFAHSFTATPTSTAFLKGDRIRVVAFVDDTATTGTMASGYTFSINVNGSAASIADSYVQFAENFTFPFSAEKILTASDNVPATDIGFGNEKAIACSSDGSIVVVGAAASDPGGLTDAGAVYVYSNNYATETKLLASDRAAGAQFGDSVACSSDGSVIVVGAYMAEPAATFRAGAAYIYSGTNWATETKLVASDKNSTAQFGTDVTCSSDGSQVFIGAPYAGNSGKVYKYSGSNWATETKIVGSGVYENFGVSVACSDDGSVVVVGAWAADPISNGEGAVYVYSGTNYATKKTLFDSGLATDAGLGFYVDCSADGTTVVAATYGFNENKVLVFSGNNWATKNILTSTDRAPSVACSADGSRVFVGNYWVINAAVSVFLANNYSTEVKINPSSSNSGGGVACTADGKTVLFGGVSRIFVEPVNIPYYLNATLSDIADQGTDENKIWTSR